MSNLQVANTIAKQLGGVGKLTALVGANTFVGDEKGLTFRFKMFSKANMCRVTLQPDDTYVFELLKFSPSKLTVTPFYKLDGVYCDMLIELFESKTGLYLHF